MDCFLRIAPGVDEPIISDALGQCLPQVLSIQVDGLRGAEGGALGKGGGEGNV